MADDMVWISGARTDADLIILVTEELGVRDPAKADSAVKALKKGQSVAEDACPKRIWRDADVAYPKPISDLFEADGYWIVSARAAEVITRFDLGGGSLYPVSDGVYEEDNKTRIPGDYFCWIFGNVKDAFLPDETPSKTPFGVSGTRWDMPYTLRDRDIAVSESALVGPDVWIDTKLFHSLFVSERLGKALVTAGLAEAFRLKTCRVIKA